MADNKTEEEINIQIDDAQQLIVQIMDTETRYEKDNKPYTVYKIDVRKGFNQWTVFRRYKEFRDLHMQMAKQVPGQPGLPPKRITGSMKPKVINERRTALLNYIRACASSAVMAKSREMWSFLGYVPGAEEKAKVSVEDFQLLNVLGRGSFGKVMLAKKKDTGKLHALKILKKQEIVDGDVLKHTQSEKHVLQNLDHPFLVGLQYSFQSEDKLYMVMDYVSGGDLFFHLQNTKFTEARALYYSAEIVCALGYLHENGIVYRDLKPENILLDNDGHVRLTDFGLVKEGMAPGMATRTFCGSLEYMAPEILEYNEYNKSVDWWGLGIVAYMMLTGRHPFYHSNQDEMCKRILSSELRFPSGVNLSEAGKSLLKGLLAKDPKKRLGCTSEGVALVKAHPFFASIDWFKLERKEIPAPFKPEVTGSLDVSNFDPEFTSEPAIITPTQETVLNPRVQDAFQGFTYVRQGDLAKATEEKLNVSEEEQTK